MVFYMELQGFSMNTVLLFPENVVWKWSHIKNDLVLQQQIYIVHQDTLKNAILIHVEQLHGITNVLHGTLYTGILVRLIGRNVSTARDLGFLEIISIAVTCSRDVAILHGHGNLSFAFVFKHCGLKTSYF